MEPEEDMMSILGDNGLLTTRDYGDYTVTNGGVSHNPYLTNSRYGAYATESNMIKNSKGEMVFPEVLFKIINKSIPYIMSIDIDSYENILRFNSSFDFNPEPNYVIYLNVKFDYQATDVISARKLTDKINMSFSMMHANIKFVKFIVKSISINQRDYEKEFYDIFLKKK
jgi:hypothetical protein